MRKQALCIAVAAMLFGVTNSLFAQQRGYHNAPYTRYEANAGTGNGNVVTSYEQNNVAFEASERTVVELSNGQYREWTTKAVSRGIVVRASGANSRTATSGQNVSARVYINNQFVTTLTFYANRGWKNLQTDGNENYNNISNGNLRMRYDEQRYLHNTSIPVNATIRIESQGNNLYLDFIEIENVTETPNPGYTVYNGNKNNRNDLQNFINNNTNIYLPAGTYNISGTLEVYGKTIQGAGMWFTQINFTNDGGNGGFWGHSNNSNLRDVALTRTTGYSRSNSYKGLNGVWGKIERVWVEYFECGAWFGNYNAGYGDPNADGMVIEHSRFRNNYADGINFCQGTRNSVARYCSFRNNGDDDMAIWPASDRGRGACYNNTYEYNTAEHCWFASSCALYGGYGNKYQNIIIRDNWEVGIRVNNNFPGYGFGGGTENSMSNIDVIRCGTNFGAYSGGMPAVDVSSEGWTGNQVSGVRFSCIDIREQLWEPVIIEGYNFANMNYCGITASDNSSQGSSLLNYVNNNTSCSCAVVNVPVTGVSLTQSSFNINVNGQVSLASYVSVTPSSAANQNVSYSIVSGGSFIDLNTTTGAVTGKAAGAASVRVTTDDGGFTATASINVSAATTPICEGNVIVQTTVAPVIDGTIDAIWSSAPAINIGNSIDVGASAPNLAGYSAKWRALYSDTHIYVLVEVTKPTAYSGIYAGEEATWWENSDAVELHFDGDNSKTNGGDQRHFIFRYNTPVLLGQNSYGYDGDIQANYSTSGNSWLAEIAIPVLNVNIAPTVNSVIGFDVTVNIVSNNQPGSRKGYFASFSTQDPPSNNVYAFGNVTLNDCKLPTATTADCEADNVTIIAYYSILGQRLPQAPEKGMYIILYDNGKTEKALK